MLVGLKSLWRLRRVKRRPKGRPLTKLGPQDSEALPWR